MQSRSQAHLSEIGAHARQETLESGDLHQHVAKCGAWARSDRHHDCDMAKCLSAVMTKNVNVTTSTLSTVFASEWVENALLQRTSSSCFLYMSNAMSELLLKGIRWCLTQFV